jgi:DNA-binding response OmpR family regulator
MRVLHSRIVVVGADAALRRVLRECLHRDSVELHEFDTMGDGSASLRHAEPDLVLLRLAGYSALDVLTDVRTRTNAPLLALIDATIDGVDAIEAGADDYLRLPCPAREIRAKALSALRRRRWDHRDERTLDFGSLTISPEAYEVRIHGAPVAMTQREFALLRHLATSPRRVFTRDELLESVWDASAEWLGAATVTEHVRRVRQRLIDGGAGGHWIQTVRGVGYRFEPAADRTEPVLTNSIDHRAPREAAG